MRNAQLVAELRDLADRDPLTGLLNHRAFYEALELQHQRSLETGEPMAVLLMILLSFLSAVVCYREYLHIGVGVVPAFLGPHAKQMLGWFLEICMLATNLFMLWWGIKLVEITWFQSIAEFPLITAGMAYLPIPIAGALTTLFVIERLLTRKFFAEPGPAADSPISTE